MTKTDLEKRITVLENTVENMQKSYNIVMGLLGEAIHNAVVNDAYVKNMKELLNVDNNEHK